jgi:uncharacterized protein YceK
MRLKEPAYLAAVFAAALSGCGTVVNCVNVNGTPARAIYGGVRQDAINGTNHLTEAFSGSPPSFSAMPKPPDAGRDFAVKTFCAGCGVAMLAVDLPVSAVADTLTLPVTVPATLLKKKPKGKGHAQPLRKPKLMGMPAAAVPPNAASAP